MGDQTLSKDAKGFVDSIVGYLKTTHKKSTSLPKVQTLLTRMSTKAQKEKVAHVESAVAMTPEEKDELSMHLSSLVGHDILLECQVKPSLIAGIRIKMADFIIDTSFHTKLADLVQYIER